MKTIRNLKPSRGRILPWVLTAVFLIAVDAPVRAGFTGVGCSGPIRVFENEPFVRLDLDRGDTNDAETVEYFTEDMSARAGADYLAHRGTATFAIGQRTTTVAGQDYVARSGRLTFAPLEVSQEVRVPLLPRRTGDERRSFRLEASDPSPGYSVVETTPIQILPDLRIEPESSRPHGDGSNVLTLRGTLPGRYYRVEASTDLKLWETVGGSMATGNMTAMGLDGATLSRRFFRALGE